MKTCDICGQEFEYLTVDKDDLVAYCDDCWCQYHSVCSSCGDEVLDDNMEWSEIRQDYICIDCYLNLEEDE